MFKLISFAIKVGLIFGWMGAYYLDLSNYPESLTSIFWAKYWIPYLYAILGAFLFIILYLPGHFTHNKKRAINRVNWLRWWLLGIGVYTIYILHTEIVDTIFFPFMGIMAGTVVALSFITVVISVWKLRLYVKTDFEAENFNSKYDLNKLKIKLAVPKFYKYFPLDLGSVAIKFAHGIDGSELEYENSALISEREFEFKLDFLYKGEFNVGIYRMVITGPLNLFSISLNFSPILMKVFPKISKLRAKTLQSLVGENEALKQLSKSGEKFDSREYKPGDSIKKLNWKLFSRQNELYIKDSEMASFVAERVLFLDNRIFTSNKEVQKRLEEKLSEILISLVLVFSKNKQKFRIIYLSEDESIKEEKIEHNDTDALIEKISFIKHLPTLTKKHFITLKNRMSRYSYSGEIIFITSLIDKSINDLVMTLKRNQSSNMRITLAYDDSVSQGVHLNSAKRRWGIPFTELRVDQDLSKKEKELLK